MTSPEARPLYRDQLQSASASILLGIGNPLWTNTGAWNHVQSPDQGSFRSCAGLLILIDVVASTALQRPPGLLPCPPTVLGE
jgi:hypothetical protein